VTGDTVAGRFLPTGATVHPAELADGVDAAVRALAARIAREDGRLARRMKAVAGDIERGREAGALADAARVFVPEAARASRGTTLLVATDWSTGEAIRRELPLDPAKRPQEQLEALFARARRLKRGSVVAMARLEEARTKRARLQALLEAASLATTPEDVSRACDAAHQEDPALLPGLGHTRASVATRGDSARARAKPADTSARVPYRAFITTGGARVLVGRGASDNDELTLHVARPHDLWLHAKGQPGAHVVVRLTKGQEAPAELLVDAAHLAAHFSDARGESVVDVTYVSRRYVRKRRGSPPGQVQVDREKVLVLRVDGARLASLLAREEAP